MRALVSRRLSVALLGLAAASMSAYDARADDEPATAPPSPSAPPPDVEETPPPDAPLPPPEPTAPGEPIAAPPASGDEAVPPRFGAAGQVVVMAGFGLELDYTSLLGGAASRFGTSISPGLDVFVVDRLSVGASLYVSHVIDRAENTAQGPFERKATTVGIGPRIGYAVPLGRYFSLYPRFTFGFRYVSVDRAGNGASPFISGSAPLLVHPSESFFVGIGPSFFHEISMGGAAERKTQTTASFETVVGGHWGGKPDPTDREAAPLPDPTKRYRFGERKDVLLGGDFYLGATYDSTTAAGISNGSVVISPSLDYFIVDHVSIGAGGGFDYSWTSFPSPFSPRVGSGSTTGVHGLVRVGVQASLTTRLSLYPRASFRVSHATSEASGELTTLRLALDVPLVFHVAPHFYIGCGPFIGRDVARVVNGLSSEALTTTGGLTTMLGGWL